MARLSVASWIGNAASVVLVAAKRSQRRRSLLCTALRDGRRQEAELHSTLHQSSHLTGRSWVSFSAFSALLGVFFCPSFSARFSARFCPVFFCPVSFSAPSFSAPLPGDPATGGFDSPFRVADDARFARHRHAFGGAYARTHGRPHKDADLAGAASPTRRSKPDVM
jgi:hypothetical protein